MRISDWSSDVCSSDLPHDEIDFEFLGKSPRQVQVNYYTAGKGGHETMIDLGFDASEDFHTYAFEWRPDSIRWFRSEEHMSELQSLMRISYAVFCLKKKNTTNRT